jgi:hypothetical protein
VLTHMPGMQVCILRAALARVTGLSEEQVVQQCSAWPAEEQVVQQCSAWPAEEQVVDTADSQVGAQGAADVRKLR